MFPAAETNPVSDRLSRTNPEEERAGSGHRFRRGNCPFARKGVLPNRGRHVPASGMRVGDAWRRGGVWRRHFEYGPRDARQPGIFVWVAYGFLGDGRWEEEGLG